jgi:hypothetical protein
MAERRRRPKRQVCVGRKAQILGIGTAQQVVWRPCGKTGRKFVLVDKAFFEKGAKGFVRVSLCREHAELFKVGGSES